MNENNPNDPIRLRPVILLADPHWETRGGGAVILRSLIGSEIGKGIVWATPSRTERDLSRGVYGLTSGSAGRTGRFSARADILRHAETLAVEVRELASQTGAAGIWALLHGASVSIAARLARSTSLPMHMTVHDDPVWADAVRSWRTLPLAPFLARDFRTAFRAATSVDVVSEPMAERYRKKYGVKSEVVHRGLPDPVSPAPPYDPAVEGLRVGILGSTYGYSQLRILASAAAKAAEQLGIRPKILICGEGYGDRLKAEMGGRVDVEAPGHLSEAEGIERLRSCAALYLNYPFERWAKVFRETSFPTKLSTYLYAARPLLVHAPPGTSVSELATDGGYVKHWRTANPADGAKLLVEIAKTPQAEGYQAPADALRLRYYDFARHTATMKRLLSGLGITNNGRGG